MPSGDEDAEACASSIGSGDDDGAPPREEKPTPAKGGNKGPVYADPERAGERLL